MSPFFAFIMANYVYFLSTLTKISLDLYTLFYHKEVQYYKIYQGD